ncbi:MAG: GTP 3',8-cyclase MoaA [Gammaproteobacteria bacterium]|nr:GTP 3',8-cyclase MoaA [Gammaproteobacteria bacterium]
MAETSPPNHNELRDSFGRSITYLRMSVTDRCDFRCRYCMDETPQFLPRAKVLSLEELALVGRAFVGMGVNKIRLTGGEPLVRRDVLWLVEQLGALDGLKDFAMTTNGSQLTRVAQPLKAAGLQRLNVSLDTLDAANFRDLTRVGVLEKVLAGIDSALAAGFRRIKINAVMMKGFNDHQILPLLAYVLERNMDISFIEEMPLGVVHDHDRKTAFMSSREIREKIAAHYELLATTASTGGPSRYWQIPGHASRIGFISPHSENFCAQCNRVRLTAEGKLLLCLGHEHAIDLRAVTREHPGSVTAIQQAVYAGIHHKPERHEFSHEPEVKVLRYMHHTGG